MFTDDGYRYQIILRGECGPLIAGLFGDVAIECSHGRTCIIAAVRDDSGLYGLLDRIQDLALHLVSLHELDGAEGADAEVLPEQRQSVAWQDGISHART